MKFNFGSVSLGLLGLPLALVAQQTGIGGNAIDVLNQRALSGVHVRLVLKLPDIPAVVYGAISNAAGHFSIDPVPPGTYALRPERAGFTYRGSASITLKAGERVSDVKLEFTPEAVISGRLLDGDGDPVPGIQVDAVPVRAGQDPILGDTDDRGVFRLRGAPGKYRLRANTQSRRFVGMRAGPSDDDPNAHYVTTYYPSSASEEGATVLNAVAGSELSGNEIRLVIERSLAISGVVIGLADAAELTMVFARPESGTLDMGDLVAEVRDGKFKLWALQPGVYRVTARCVARRLRSRPVQVRVENADVTDIELTLLPGDELTGTLQMTGDGKGLVVLLEPETAQDFDMLERARGEVGKDGAFRIPDLFPGRYRVSVGPLPDNAYLAETKLNGVVVAGLLDLSAGVRGSALKVKVQTDGGQIFGTVTASNSERLINTPAMVVLNSEAGELTGHAVPVTAQGSYIISGIRPGKYRIFVQVGLDDMNSSAAVSQEVVVPPGGRLTKNLQLTPKANDDAK